MEFRFRFCIQGLILEFKTLADLLRIDIVTVLHGKVLTLQSLLTPDHRTRREGTQRCGS